MKESSADYKPDIEGKIIYLHPTGGWGYINSHEIQFSKIYFHWTGLSTRGKQFTELKKNDVVRFTALKRDQGWKAINIEVKNEQEKAG